MENRRHELKKQIEKRHETTTINSKRKRDCVVHLLEDPNVNEVLMIQDYVNVLRSNQNQNRDAERDPNPNPIQDQKTQCTINESKLCEEKENHPVDNSKDLPFKIPEKVKKQSKRNKKSRVKIPTKPTQFHSIFDNNLLRENGSKLGCACTAINTYDNPFLKDLFEELPNSKNTIKCAAVHNNRIITGHAVTFSPIDEFQYVITKTKPTLHVSEYVTGTEAAIGTSYSLIVNLIKNNIFVDGYIKKHIFTKAGKVLLKIRISDYADFDTIYYCHVISNNPEVKLNLEKVNSIKIGKSILMFLSKTIQWTEPGPKVIVEKVERLPEGQSFY